MMSLMSVVAGPALSRRLQCKFLVMVSPFVLWGIPLTHGVSPSISARSVEGPWIVSFSNPPDLLAHRAAVVEFNLSRHVGALRIPLLIPTLRWLVPGGSAHPFRCHRFSLIWQPRSLMARNLNKLTVDLRPVEVLCIISGPVTSQ